MDYKPSLTFFTELDPEPLTKLFEDRFVLDDLKALDAKVSMGLIDLSETRAKVVQRLNKISVPVTAWLLLPKDQGYWFGMDNYCFAIKRYEEFKAWTEKYGLKWAGIGLDIEPDYKESALMAAMDPKVLPAMWRRLKDKPGYCAAHSAYLGLVNQIHADGYEVEAYHSAFVVDDAQAKSTVLKRALGLIDVQVDRVVLMLYSSFARPYGEAMMLSYGNATDSFGIGVTGGGVEQDGVKYVPPLSWAEFSTDLRIAASFNKPVHVFSLEGCVDQGFLSRLTTFDWTAPVEEAVSTRVVVESSRGLLKSVLWALERPFVILLGLFAGIASVIFFKSRRKRSSLKK